ncbi:putative membrane protein [Yersinia pestis PY-47]|nr:hypothetical protein A1122_18520 [Yersinia pestis A1122]EIR34310.1 putative membrane protein [Yersinia pestis PY-10]EIR49162.1 putative membrane protein [Yersinia pestis PY-15]EIR92946.1 putative membrane protein [Yersinia pestis PY-42]EIR94091.1 putative membrane protein [Yersinia pestis PY-45]EIS07006.1 putative membrane protein [Yersinia pestis PY-47]EIS30700.1 putative membrane protein [Yersinia pestis PY-55]EIS58186.1 putative membrane protein [Yersinia pestis PY-61]EIS68495.1 putat
MIDITQFSRFFLIGLAIHQIAQLGLSSLLVIYYFEKLFR